MGGPIFNRPVSGEDDGLQLFGVHGLSNKIKGFGVTGLSKLHIGVRGISGDMGGGGGGVLGESETGFGVKGQCNTNPGVWGVSLRNHGVLGQANSTEGVYGQSITGDGVHGYSDRGIGVFGHCRLPSGMVPAGSNIGVVGDSASGVGVWGSSKSNFGVYGTSNVIGVGGRSDIGWGVYGRSDNGYAAFLDGKVRVTGYLYKAGGGFEIDHPLDPANKYLYHSFVESPDIKNLYDGVVTLNAKGEAEIELPDWFGALNKDFRYQLTAIGSPGPNLYVEEKISEVSTKRSKTSRFKIAGGTSRMKVSWQVTGIRKDPYAKAHPIKVEENKPDKERGYYIHPELYGKSAKKSISYLLLTKEEQELLIKGKPVSKTRKREKT